MALLFMSVSLVTGVLIAGHFEFSVAALALFAAGTLSCLVLLVRIKRPVLPAIAALALLAGIARVEMTEQENTSPLVNYHGNPDLVLEGVVNADPEDTGSVISFPVRVERINSDGKWTYLSGPVLVTTRESMDFAPWRERPYIRYGDRVQVEGALEPPPELEDFDYPAFLSRQGISSVMPFASLTFVEEGKGSPVQQQLSRVRRRMASSLSDTVAEPHASLGQALLLGIRDKLPEEIESDFRDTGTSHILAISGLNTSILMGLMLAICQWLIGRRRNLYLIAPLLLIWGYTITAGAPPSAVRAAIMGTTYLAALALGRPNSILPALSFAAVIMVLVSPPVLWDISFQLSFASMAGIALLARPLSKFIQRALGQDEDHVHDESALVRAAADITAMTVAATLATLPLVAFYFQRISLISLPASLLVLPVMAPLLVFDALASIAGLVNTGMAAPFGWGAWAFSAYTTGVVGLLAKVPLAVFDTGPLHSTFVWLYYGTLAAIIWVSSRLTDFSAMLSRLRTLSRYVSASNRPAPWWAIVSLSVIAGIAWTAALSLPDSRLHVIFSDAGQGDSALIITPGGKQVLVDGGPGRANGVRLVGGRMPFWDRHIDMVVLTHPHEDHSAGLVEVLRKYEVASILERRLDYDSPAYREWQAAVDSEGAVVVQAMTGVVIDLGDDVLLRVLGPPESLLHGTDNDIDNASVTIQVEFGETSFLFTGDIQSDMESWLSSHIGLDSDVLKVAHHGSKTSSSMAFLQAASPEAVVISVGADNRFGHPHPETLETLRQFVAPEQVFVTAERGTVEFTSDGRQLYVATQR